MKRGQLRTGSMEPLADHLAALTGSRDRELLDVTLVGALVDMLRPHTAMVHRIVGEAPDQRWILRARLVAGAGAAESDPLSVDLDDLPRLATQPERQTCLEQQRIIATEGPAWVTRFPMVSDSAAVGVFEIETDDPLSADQMRLVVSVLRIYRNFEELLDYSERDTLTGLLNRKTFDESFLRAAATATPGGATAPAEDRRAADASGPWLGVIDIDHFKRVNDEYGHLIGDEVLLLLGRLMRASFRFHDRLYRFGGEEFVVLLRCGDAHGAALAFERLRANVEKYALPRVGRVTVSVGFTAVRRGDSPSSAFERADRAVYHAKENGRNRVVHHEDLVQSGAAVDQSPSGDVELF